MINKVLLVSLMILSLSLKLKLVYAEEVSGEYLVQYETSFSSLFGNTDFRSTLRQSFQNQISKMSTFSLHQPIKVTSNVDLVSVVSLQSSKEVKKELLKIPGVKRVEPNRKIYALGIRSQFTADPMISSQYGMKQIHADEVWEKLAGRYKPITVAVLDTGIDYNHEDLAQNLWINPKPASIRDLHGIDFINRDGDPMDDNSHGTMTSGILGAYYGNGKGMSGVAPRVKIMAVKILNNEGHGTTAQAIQGIRYAVTRGAKILSNSWGDYDLEDSELLRDEIERARLAGVLFVAAAGNSRGTGGENIDLPGSVVYPAAYPMDNMITVVGTDSRDVFADYISNYGFQRTHLAAPGVRVLATFPNNKYAFADGTSVACPHVAGAAALVWSLHPDWDYRKVRAALLSSVDKLPSLKGKTKTEGRLNVRRAIELSFR